MKIIEMDLSAFDTLEQARDEIPHVLEAMGRTIEPAGKDEQRVLQLLVAGLEFLRMELDRSDGDWVETGSVDEAKEQILATVAKAAEATYN